MFRLTRSLDLKRVRQQGKSYAHPLIVLIAAHSDEPWPRFGVVAGRSIGGAVQRNRCKRLLRASVDAVLPSILPGWDILLQARKGLEGTTCDQSKEALLNLLERARLVSRI